MNHTPNSKISKSPPVPAPVNPKKRQPKKKAAIVVVPMNKKATNAPLSVVPGLGGMIKKSPNRYAAMLIAPWMSTLSDYDCKLPDRYATRTAILRSCQIIDHVVPGTNASSPSNAGRFSCLFSPKIGNTVAGVGGDTNSAQTYSVSGTNTWNPDNPQWGSFGTSGAYDTTFYQDQSWDLFFATAGLMQWVFGTTGCTPALPLGTAPAMNSPLLGDLPSTPLGVNYNTSTGLVTAPPGNYLMEIRIAGTAMTAITITPGVNGVYQAISASAPTAANSLTVEVAFGLWTSDGSDSSGLTYVITGATVTSARLMVMTQSAVTINNSSVMSKLRCNAMSVLISSTRTSFDDAGDVAIATLPPGAAEANFLQEVIGNNYPGQLQYWENVGKLAADKYQGVFKLGGYGFWKPAQASSLELLPPTTLAGIHSPCIVTAGKWGNVNLASGAQTGFMRSICFRIYEYNTTNIFITTSKTKVDPIQQIEGQAFVEEVPCAMPNKFHLSVIRDALVKLGNGVSSIFDSATKGVTAAGHFGNAAQTYLPMISEFVGSL